MLGEKVIDETMRVVNISLYTYREATADVNISGKQLISLYYLFIVISVSCDETY